MVDLDINQAPSTDRNKLAWLLDNCGELALLNTHSWWLILCRHPAPKMNGSVIDFRFFSMLPRLLHEWCISGRSCFHVCFQVFVSGPFFATPNWVSQRPIFGFGSSSQQDLFSENPITIHGSHNRWTTHRIIHSWINDWLIVDTIVKWIRSFEV